MCFAQTAALQLRGCSGGDDGDDGDRGDRSDDSHLAVIQIPGEGGVLPGSEGSPDAGPARTSDPEQAKSAVIYGADGLGDAN